MSRFFRYLRVEAVWLADVIRSLTPEEQESVEQFVHFLKRWDSPSPSPFLLAVDEFIEQHPELLRRLAQ